MHQYSLNIYFYWKYSILLFYNAIKRQKIIPESGEVKSFSFLCSEILSLSQKHQHNFYDSQAV